MGMKMAPTARRGVEKAAQHCFRNPAKIAWNRPVWTIPRQNGEFRDVLKSASNSRLRACDGDRRAFARVCEHRRRQPFSRNAPSIRPRLRDSELFGDRVRGVRIWRMIKRGLFAALVFAVPACLVSAQDAKVSVDMIGIGGMSCAHWRSTREHRLEGTVWIYGFWTGLNYVAAASDQTQAKIDMAAIAGEVENTCAQQTSQTLASAVWTTYLASKR
jgi:hypothetical protein